MFQELKQKLLGHLLHSMMLKKLHGKTVVSLAAQVVLIYVYSKWQYYISCCTLMIRL